MIATVTNLSATDPVDVPHPFRITLAAAGVKALGVNLSDLQDGDPKGKPAYKDLNEMIARGLITCTFADDANTRDTLDKARNA